MKSESGIPKEFPKPSIDDGSFQNEDCCRLPVPPLSRNWAQRRLIGFGAKRGSEQPVSFEALNEFVTVDDRIRDRAQHICIGLDLRIQVAGHAREIVERTAKILDENSEVCIYAVEGEARVRERFLQLQVYIGRNQPFAE